MGKKTSVFAYTASISSNVLRVAYQKLQQIWYVNILKVIISDMENHGFVGMLTPSPTHEQ
jgi:hypothetical protein